MLRPIGEVGDGAEREHRRRTELYLKALVYIHGMFDLASTWVSFIVLIFMWSGSISKPFALFAACFSAIMNVQGLLFTLVIGCIQRAILVFREPRLGLNQTLMEAFSTLFSIVATVSALVVMVEAVMIYYWSVLDDSSLPKYFVAIFLLNLTGFCAVVVFGKRVSKLVPELTLAEAAFNDELLSGLVNDNHKRRVV